MSTWDTGPFGNDTAADFCGDLDDAAAGERADMIRGVLLRAVESAEYLDAAEGEEAVAAAALVAAQCPGGDPPDLVCGPEWPLPDLGGVRGLAAEAVDRVLSEESELREFWDGSHGGPWRAGAERIREVLCPPETGEQLSLF